MSDATFQLFDMNGQSMPRCPKCGEEFQNGFASISGGAICISDDGKASIHSDRLQGFLNIGFPVSYSSMNASDDVLVVDDAVGGQFDLQWCSIKCMREWLNDLINTIETQVLGRQNDM